MRDYREVKAKHIHDLEWTTDHIYSGISETERKQVREQVEEATRVLRQNPETLRFAIKRLYLEIASEINTIDEIICDLQEVDSLYFAMEYAKKRQERVKT